MSVAWPRGIRVIDVRSPSVYIAVAATVLAALGLPAGCEPAEEKNITRFDHLDTVDLTINEHRFRTWVARADNDIRAGLMHVTAEELEPLADGVQRGMLFVFDYDRDPSYGFWMKDVAIPLDIAFCRADGTIVTIRTMAPFDHRSTSPTAAYRYAIEVRGGLFQQLGIKEGDLARIPESVLNNTP